MAGGGGGAGGAAPPKQGQPAPAQPAQTHAPQPAKFSVPPPTKEELGNFSAALSKLWEIDYNRLVPDKDYTVDLGRGKKPYQQGDVAPNNLFARVDESVFKRPTYSAFIALLNNYERLAGIAENVTRQEKKEESVFIAECMKTAPVQYAHKWLVEKKLAPPNADEFARKLSEIWFKPYRRVKDNDSSGFEHVFVGEEKEGQIMGMHNWVQLYLEEKAGRLNYNGYILPRKRQPANHEHQQVLTIQFTWCDALKPVSTSFVGVSPEFELAAYTMGFLAGQEKTKTMMGPYEVQITCFANGHGKFLHLGSSFPESLD